MHERRKWKLDARSPAQHHLQIPQPNRAAEIEQVSRPTKEKKESKALSSPIIRLPYLDKKVHHYNSQNSSIRTKGREEEWKRLRQIHLHTRT
ncbi:hypothetical protein B0T26DRAFT_447846 [Lasiosphaeria miniovina]|uniref:Uncharacterized protein n=1 Tax=Lasiosphaeria miniovina TaxID=1954250 RepID=A0AA40DKB4_9PEZI|nr:uncharacterized protein B0T26DRAFT_447846 [Lasiosphaeria miniovina]KAK0706340.1 hypothetical protein B0T26DRAFT_447846 [Lasiosphaeria miniovina]